MRTQFYKNFTECNSRNNGMLRNDTQTDLDTYIS